MLNQIELSRIDLNLLTVFEVVFCEQHVGRAAGLLNLTPSTISHSLNRLRQLLHDPLFVRHPRGVAPTERAMELAPRIMAILEQVRGVIAAAAPFDPGRSSRCFVVGTTDGIGAVVLPPLLSAIRRTAPGIDVRVRLLMPSATPAALDSREIDMAVVPLDDAPARFATRTLYEDRFVIAMRDGHPLGPEPSLKRYCAASHLLVSATGDAHGFVDTALERLGLSRRVVLTVPSFFLGLAVIAETDLVAAMAHGQVRMHGPRFGVVAAPLPTPLDRGVVSAVAPVAALSDAGLVWFLDTLEKAIAAAAATDGD